MVWRWRWTCSVFLALSLAGFTANAAEWGARVSADRLVFRLFSANASRVQIELFAQAWNSPARITRGLSARGDGVWETEFSRVELDRIGLWGAPVYYGYRAWGPNWEFDPAWRPGSLAGFQKDVDGQGHRFNPNKLLLDPYAREMSHDPVGFRSDRTLFTDKAIYASGPADRGRDNAEVAPKGVVLPRPIKAAGRGPRRELRDEIIYEVHVRGFTMNDSSIPAELRGTYAGAARKAGYLKSLGVTAVEFLPVQETQNDQNDVALGTRDDNYWGYMTLSYFAPDRRYAADRTPGGPTREFARMVDAFHREGIKVYIDVVYNHTAEAGIWAGNVDLAEHYSFRGLDNASYYLLPFDKRFYWDATGIGNTFNTAHKPVADLIVDSLRYWREQFGVDGFRFDLAAVLGNRCTESCFRFDNKDSTLNRIARELPDTDLIAEPWAIGIYEVGSFPAGWAEWNGVFRDTFRKAQNRRGWEGVSAGELASRLAGSEDLFADEGRGPSTSINFLAAHDGFTLRDLYAYNNKQNHLSWPYGPSDGGEDFNRSWDQGGDKGLQRQAARTGLALTLLAAGTPMINGGDEFYRTQFGNNNPYNLDSAANWLDWSWRGAEDAEAKAAQRFYEFTRHLMQFRQAHPALRREHYYVGRDINGNSLPDIQWLKADGGVADAAYMNSVQDFLSYRIDASETANETAISIFVAYNASEFAKDIRLPVPAPGRSWYRAADTAAWFESGNNSRAPGQEEKMPGKDYHMHPSSLILMIEK